MANGAMSFASVEDPTDRILRLIGHDIANPAKPYRWTFAGRFMVAKGIRGATRMQATPFASQVTTSRFPKT